MISAHRSGAGTGQSAENGLETLKSAAELDCEFVEFDVQRCADGVFVLRHDGFVDDVDGGRLAVSDISYAELVALDGPTATMREALQSLSGRSRAHVDLKFVSDPDAYSEPAQTFEVQATMEILSLLEVTDCVVTTLEDRSVRAVRAWSRANAPGLLVGLSLGRDTAGLPRLRSATIRTSELFGELRLLNCDANLVVADQRLAKKRLAKVAQRLDLPLLVWTVDDPEDLRYWIEDSRAWLVTTNFPERALDIRQQLIQHRDAQIRDLGLDR